MHSHKYPPRSGFEPGTSRLQAPVDTNEQSRQAGGRAVPIIPHGCQAAGISSLISRRAVLIIPRGCQAAGISSPILRLMSGGFDYTPWMSGRRYKQSNIASDVGRF